MLRRLALLILLAATAAVGCGVDAERGAGFEAPAEDESILVAALGDSITAGSPLWDPIPGSARRSDRPWTIAASSSTGLAEADPSITFRNCGVFGERTDRSPCASRVRRRRRTRDRAGGIKRHIAQAGRRRGRG